MPQILSDIEVSAIEITIGLLVFEVACSIAQAFFKKKLSSRYFLLGTKHKVGMILAIILGVLLEIAQAQLNLGVDVHILILICTYICLVEIVTAVEVIAELSPKMKNSKFLSIFDFAYEKLKPGDKEKGE